MGAPPGGTPAIPHGTKKKGLFFWPEPKNGVKKKRSGARTKEKGERKGAFFLLSAGENPENHTPGDPQKNSRAGTRGSPSRSPSARQQKKHTGIFLRARTPLTRLDLRLRARRIRDTKSENQKKKRCFFVSVFREINR